MATNKKARRRRKQPRSGPSAITMTLQPGEVPSDQDLEAEAAALEEELQGRYDLAKKDELNLAALQQMTTDELGKVAKKEKIEDFATLGKQKLVFEILRTGPKARADDRRRHLGSAPRWLRLSPEPRVLVHRVTRRCLRQPLTDPALRSAEGSGRPRPDQAPQGDRDVFRPAPRGGGERR